MNKKRSLLERDGVLTIITSVLCVILGLLVGFLAVLIINPQGAFGAITGVVENFFAYSSSRLRIYNFGSTLAKTAPLIMCSLSVLFAYKVGLFNIGAAGQYALGAGAAIYSAYCLQLPWYVCLLLGILVGGISGALGGILKAFCNVNVVISGIMLNWISLYLVNMVLTNVKETSTTYTLALRTNAPAGLIPSLGLSALFSGNKYVTIAIPLAILFAVLVWVVMEKTKLGYELKATGLNKNAAKYAGMKEKQNIILTMVVSGCIAGLGAAFLYLSGIEQWSCAQTSVPAMGFNGIAAAFLGGLNPIGCIFSAFFIQHITSGGSYVDKMIYSSQISDLIAAIIIYSCGFVMFFKHCIARGLVKSGKGGKK